MFLADVPMESCVEPVGAGEEPMSTVNPGFRRRMLRNTAACWGVGAWAVVAGALAVPLLLHRLGAEEFGLWALVQTFSAGNGWLSVFTVGLGVAATRRVAAQDGPARHDVVAVFTYLGVVLAALWLLTARWVLPAAVDVPAAVHDPFVAALPWFSLQLAAETYLVGVGAMLEGGLRVDVARLLDGARRALVLAVPVAVALRGGRLVEVTAATAVASLVAAAIGTLVLHRRGLLRVAWRVHDPVGLLRAARATTALNVTGVVHRSMDRLLVGFTFGPAAVVGVEIASRLRDVAALVLSTTSYTAMPGAAWLRARGRTDQLRSLVMVGTKITLAATWTVIGIGLVFRREILTVWVGDHEAAVAAYAVFAFGFLAVEAPQQVGANVLTGSGALRAFTTAAWLGVLVNLGASIVLLERNGPIGVFQGTLVGSVVVVPLALRAIVDAIGSDLRTFARQAIAPALPVAAAVVATGEAVRLLDLGPAATVVLGTGVCSAVAAAVFFRAVMRPGEVVELLRPSPAAGPVGSASGEDLRHPVRAATVDE